MGRIKTSLVKRVTKELMKSHAAEFNEDFAHNKEVLNTISNMPSKKIRNVVAGYATRLRKAQR